MSGIERVAGNTEVSSFGAPAPLLAGSIGRHEVNTGEAQASASTAGVGTFHDEAELPSSLRE